MLLSDGLSGQFMTGIVRLKEVWFGNSLKGGVKENQKQKEERKDTSAGDFRGSVDLLTP